MLNTFNHHFIERILYLEYLCRCLGLGLFYVYEIYFSFSASFSLSVILKTSFKQTYLLFTHFLEYLLIFLVDNVDEESE